MATVRISKRLIDQILEKARGLYTNRIREAQQLPEGFGDRVYEAWLNSGEREIMEVIKSKGRRLDLYYTKRDCIRIATINGYTIRQSLPLSSPRWTRLEVDFESPEGSKLVQEYLTWKDNCDRLIKECDDYIDKIRKFLKEQTTLNQAIKLWPALKELLPVEIIDKLNERKPRERRTLTTSVNVEDLNAEIVRAKFLGII